MLTRTYGGAISNIKSSFEPKYEELLKTKIEEKKRIAKFAVSLLEKNDSIIMEASTTNIYFSELIPNNIDLKVFTNSPVILSNLRNLDTSIQVFCSGGFLKKETNSLIGTETCNFFENIIVDKAFIPISAINKDKILTYSSKGELEVIKSIIRASKIIIALSDSSKFNSALLYKLGYINIINILITDKNINPKLHNELTHLGITVYTV